MDEWRLGGNRDETYFDGANAYCDRMDHWMGGEKTVGVGVARSGDDSSCCIQLLDWTWKIILNTDLLMPQALVFFSLGVD